MDNLRKIRACGVSSLARSEATFQGIPTSCNLSLSCERSPADTVVAHVTQAVSCLLAMDAARGDASKREAAYQARAVQQSERKHLRLHRQESVFVVAKR